MESIQEQLAGLPGVSVEILVNKREPEAVPLARIGLDEMVIERSTVEVINELIEGDPAVAVSQAYLQDSALGGNPMVLQTGEEEIVAQRIRAAVGGELSFRPGTPPPPRPAQPYD